MAPTPSGSPAFSSFLLRGKKKSKTKLKKKKEERQCTRLKEVSTGRSRKCRSQPNSITFAISKHKNNTYSSSSDGLLQNHNAHQSSSPSKDTLIKTGSVVGYTKVGQLTGKIVTAYDRALSQQDEWAAMASKTRPGGGRRERRLDNMSQRGQARDDCLRGVTLVAYVIGAFLLRRGDADP